MASSPARIGSMAARRRCGPAGLTNHPVEQMDGVVLHSGAGEGTDQMAADPAGGGRESAISTRPPGGASAPSRAAPRGAEYPVGDGPPALLTTTSYEPSGASSAWAVPSEKAQLATRVRRRARAMASREGFTPMAVRADVTASAITRVNGRCRTRRREPSRPGPTSWLTKSWQSVAEASLSSLSRPSSR